MDFFCLPVICGCQEKVTPEGDITPRICPNCHNAAVHSAKSKEYFELCFVPLIPMSSKHVWLCSICRWRTENQGGWEPPMVTSFAPQAGYYYPPQPPPTWQGGAPQQQYQQGPGYGGGYGGMGGQQGYGGR